MRDNYPMMSDLDRKNAPWNQEEPKPKKIMVCISMTLSKTVPIEVSDYKLSRETDEEGNKNINYDFSESDLKSAAREQIVLPNEKVDDWAVDDFEVVLDE